MSLSIDVRSPLLWPVTARRTPAGQRKYPQFKSDRRDVTIHVAKGRILRELERMVTERKADGNRYYRASQIVLSLNDTVGRRASEDPGAALYLKLDGRQYTLPCDKWLTTAGNVAAIAAHLEAMRGMERWGVGTLDQLFEGYAQLPRATVVEENWYTVLGVDEDAPADVVERAYREACLKNHPDVGGSHNSQARLNAAIGFWRDNRAEAQMNGGIDGILDRDDFLRMALSYGVPQYLVGGLERWAYDRIPPGGFLLHFLAGDLYGAMKRSDPLARHKFEFLYLFIVHHMPEGCFGSVQNMQDWALPTGAKLEAGN